MSRKPSVAIDPIARRNRRAACSRWYAVGAAIPHDTPDLRLAIKREVWTRGLSLGALERRLGFSPTFLSNLLGTNDHKKDRRVRRIVPGVLDRIIEHLHITPKVARRLHQLGALQDGWKIGDP